MKKILIILTIILATQTLAIGVQKKILPGRYICPYYANGRDNKCTIDVLWGGKAETECDFLTLDLIKMLLNGNKCELQPFKYYECNYGKAGSCDVGLGYKEKDILVGCEGKVPPQKGIADAKAGKCTQIYGEFYGFED